MDPEIWRGPGSRSTQILDAFTPSAWISGLDSRIWRGSGSRWAQILEELLPSAWIASYFPHPGRTRVAGPPNRLAPRSIAKVAVLLLEIAVFQQILCSPPRSNEASDGARTEDRESDVSMGISALRSPRSAHRRTLLPMLTSETGVKRGVGRSAN